MFTPLPLCNRVVPRVFRWVCAPQLMDLIRRGRDRGDGRIKGRVQGGGWKRTRQSRCARTGVRGQSEDDEAAWKHLLRQTQHALSFQLALSAEGGVSPNGFGRYHSFDVCPTTDESHMVIMFCN